VHRQGEREGEGTLEWNASAGGESRPRPIDRLEGKRRKEKTTQKHNQAQHFTKAKYSQEVQSSLTDSQAKYERVCYINPKRKKITKKG
jgi:hypothetical protein